MALPWTMPNRRKKTLGAFNCQTCMTAKPQATEVTRRVMHCGYLPRDSWGPAPIKPKSLGPEPYNLDECPGSIVRQPGVREGREAYEALKANVLHLYDPHGTHTVFEAAMVAQHAFDLFTAEELEPRPGAR